VNRKSKRTITRRELYDLIWDRPMWKVAPEFGLSGNGLAKLCRREAIPVPERGYWAKLAHGKRVKKPTLQPPPSGKEALVIVATPTRRNALEETMPKPLAALLRAERQASEPIIVPKTPKAHGLVEAWPMPQKPSYGVARFTAGAESRRRRIATVLFREVEQRGGKVSKNRWHEHDRDRFSIELFNATVNVTFQERLKMVKIPPDPKKPYSYERTEWHPTGLLRLRFENYFNIPIRREWNETEEKPIEGRLREILIALYFAVEAQRQSDEQDRRETARRAAEGQRRWEREERERREREAVQALLSQVKAWDDARRIRDYVNAVKGCAGKESGWVDWALGVADRLDPSTIEEHVADER
jgi:hypothetical protein